MEGPDPSGSDAGDQAIRRTEKVHRRGESKGADRPAAPDGGERSADPHRLSRGTAPGGVHPDGAWV